MQFLKFGKNLPTVLFLILFLFLIVAPLHAHTLHVTSDTFNDSGMANNVNGNNVRVHVDDQDENQQGFAQFDLSTLPNGITSADVDKATLRLFVRNVMTPGNVDVHLVTSTWDEATLTFNSSPTYNATPFAADVPINSGDDEQFITVDITTQLKDWIDTPTSNYGIALIPDTVNVRFASKEIGRHPMELEVALIGPEGPQGIQGIQGIQGEQGVKGDTGEKGDQGDTGDTGPIGPQGPQGDQGIQGVKGDTGDQGIQGEKGDKGDKGDTGDQGIAGTDGTDGVDGESGKDDADGVEITFTREFQYDPGTGAVDAIDINGTDLVISPTDPTVTLGGQTRSVLATADIPNTTPQLQQVIIDLPSTLLAGNYKLKLSNTQGDSETVLPLSNLGGGNDSYTKLLLHGDGNGATFMDDSSSNHSITASGDATQSAVKSQFGGKSASLDGSGDSLSLPNSGDWDFGTEDFTIDFWINFTNWEGPSNYDTILSTHNGATGQWYITFGSNNEIEFVATNHSEVDYVKQLATDQWYHFAFVRNNGTLKIYEDGVEKASGSLPNNLASTIPLTIGSFSSPSNGFNGYLDELRISKGVARWTANFTPPTAPYN